MFILRYAAKLGLFPIMDNTLIMVFLQISGQGTTAITHSPFSEDSGNFVPLLPCLSSYSITTPADSSPTPPASPGVARSTSCLIHTPAPHG